MTTPNGRSPIRSVAVLGGGIVGLSAAIAFSRALSGLSVHLIDTPADPAALADHMPGTLPSIAGFHDRIGLTERDAIAAGATHRVGTRLAGWGADGADFILAQGDHGAAVAPGAFHQHWLNARRAGRVAPFHAFSAAAMLAGADRFVHPAEDPASPLHGFAYALRLDPPRYRDLLRTYARHLRIAADPGDFGGIERRTDGGVAALLLADGRRIVADLYLDCTGPAALLHTAVDTGWEDWCTCLPVDRLLISTGPAQAPTPTDDLAALPAGWRFSYPLRDRTLLGLAYRAAQTPESRARRILPQGSAVVTIRPGMRTRPWAHNVLALGDAAVALDPLADANLHLAHAAILRAIDLLPGRDCAAEETAEYNRRACLEAARVRDYQTAYLHGPGRPRGDFWKAARLLPRPDGLAHTIDQFARRGHLPHYDEESFDAQSWRGLLLGLGVVPALADPVASTTPPATDVLERLARATAALPTHIPPYPAYLARIESQR